MTSEKEEWLIRMMNGEQDVGRTEFKGSLKEAKKFARRWASTGSWLESMLEVKVEIWDRNPDESDAKLIDVWYQYSCDLSKFDPYQLAEKVYKEEHANDKCLDCGRVGPEIWTPGLGGIDKYLEWRETEPNMPLAWCSCKNLECNKMWSRVNENYVLQVAQEKSGTRRIEREWFIGMTLNTGDAPPRVRVDGEFVSFIGTEKEAEDFAEILASIKSWPFSAGDIWVSIFDGDPRKNKDAKIIVRWSKRYLDSSYPDNFRVDLFREVLERYKEEHKFDVCPGCEGGEVEIHSPGLEGVDSFVKCRKSHSYLAWCQCRQCGEIWDYIDEKYVLEVAGSIRDKLRRGMYVPPSGAGKPARGGESRR